MFPYTQGVSGTFLRRRSDQMTLKCNTNFEASRSIARILTKQHPVPRPSGYKMPDGSHEALECFQFVSLADLNRHQMSYITIDQDWIHYNGYPGLNLEFGMGRTRGRVG
ncbi:hypothetical protein N7455_007466 [Penicillium solitum]|uniref:uncharacterized protein n=1 Tax=Penicillium solitum TaxID=60172 RepID=UPI001847F5BA|nr:hypothetical protein HAV15_012798 [Penicillium sp. str. \